MITLKEFKKLTLKDCVETALKENIEILKKVVDIEIKYKTIDNFNDKKHSLIEMEGKLILQVSSPIAIHEDKNVMEYLHYQQFLKELIRDGLCNLIREKYEQET